MTQLTRAQLDAICATRTGFNSFSALVASHANYTPTIQLYQQVERGVYRLDEELVGLAEAFDNVMAALGDPRRAYRTDNRHPDSTTIA